MAQLVFDLLTSYDGEMAYASGPLQSAQLQIPPEIAIFPSARKSAAPVEESTMIGVGAIVRITRAPYLGKIGTLRSFSEKREAVESGILTQCAEIELTDHQNVWVPVVNLEKIEWVSEA